MKCDKYDYATGVVGTNVITLSMQKRYKRQLAATECDKFEAVSVI